MKADRVVKMKRYVFGTMLPKPLTQYKAFDRYGKVVAVGRTKELCVKNARKYGVSVPHGIVTEDGE